MYSLFSFVSVVMVMSCKSRGVIIITSYTGDTVLDQCDNALNTLQRSRANLNLHRRRGIGASYSQLFLRESKRSRDLESIYRKRCHAVGWTHTFYCLSQCQQSVIPCSNYERDALLEAGLGEKRVFIPDLDASAEEFRSVLYKAFPKLNDAGGYSFGKCRANSKHIELLSSHCLTSPKVLRSRVGNTRTYIIPMQRNLNLSTVMTDVKCNVSLICMQYTCAMQLHIATHLNIHNFVLIIFLFKVFETCLLCMEEVPFHSLNKHLATCTQPRYVYVCVL